MCFEFGTDLGNLERTNRRFCCLPYLEYLDECPVEPTVSFGEALRDRAYWLVGLLVMQSFSGIILSRNEALLADHPVIIYFLTMLVGAGGNAGNQASVRGKSSFLKFSMGMFCDFHCSLKNSVLCKPKSFEAWRLEL